MSATLAPTTMDRTDVRHLLTSGTKIGLATAVAVVLYLWVSETRSRRRRPCRPGSAPRAGGRHRRHLPAWPLVRRAHAWRASPVPPEWDCGGPSSSRWWTSYCSGRSRPTPGPGTRSAAAARGGISRSGGCSEPSSRGWAVRSWPGRPKAPGLARTATPVLIGAVVSGRGGETRGVRCHAAGNCRCLALR